MSSGAVVITTIVCPTIGMILSNFMWITPLPVVLEARYTRTLGLVNPYPFVVTVLNCIGWVFYGCMKNDFFIFFSNIFGCVLGLYYTLVCLTVIAKKRADSDFSNLYLGVESLLLFAVFFWGIIGLIVATAFKTASDPHTEATNLVGYISSAFTIAYYAAPLTVMANVFAKKDSSSLYFQLILINFINALMWFFYGILGVGDLNISIPNGIGAALAFSQLILCFIFPARDRKEGVTWKRIEELLRGRIAPTFETSEKMGSSDLTKPVLELEDAMVE